MFNQDPFYKCIREWADLSRLCNKVFRAWRYLDLSEENNEKEIRVFLFYVSGSKTDFYLSIDYIDINAGALHILEIDLRKATNY